jgi:hypothetical protein
VAALLARCVRGAVIPLVDTKGDALVIVMGETVWRGVFLMTLAGGSGVAASVWLPLLQCPLPPYFLFSGDSHLAQPLRKMPCLCRDSSRVSG